MKSFVLTVTILTLAAATAAESQTIEKGAAMLKAVVHVNYEDETRQEKMLGNLENILDAEPESEIEVVSHGAGMTLIQRSKSKFADKIKALIGRGVRFAGCENTMQKKSIERTDLLEGVTTVPSGAVEVLLKQQQGFGYFRP
jgi:intracellular sulfur oxidation DsrE/DsrF family protein